MSRRKNPDLSTQFFQKTDPESEVGFEITLAALLATAVLSFPTSQAQWIGELAAFSVLFVTLIRRVSVASPFAPQSDVMAKTARPIEFATTVCVIVLFFSLTEHITDIFGGRVVLWFSIITTLVLLCLVFIEEMVFRDYLIWWYVKFDEKEDQAETFEGLWQAAKLAAFWASRARRYQESWREINKRVEKSLPDLSHFDIGKINKKMFFARLFVLTILFTLLYVPAMIVGVSSGDFFVPLALVGVVFIRDHSCYQYIAYGSTTYEEFRKPFWEMSIWAIVYMGILLLLLGQTPFSVLL